MDYAFDIVRERFIRKNGLIGTVEGKDELRQRIYRLFKTQKNSYAAYPAEYGTDLRKIALICRDDYTASELIREEAEKALKTIDGVLGMRDFSFKRDGEVLKLSFTVDTVYGESEKIEEEL